MSTTFTPLEGCLKSATERQTALANSVVHLFQDTLSPTPSTPTADYTAAECDFKGYAAITVTAWGAPIAAPGSGYMIASALCQFMYDSGAVGGAASNNVKGCYLLDAGSKNRQVVIFTDLIEVNADGTGVLFYLIQLFPTNQTTT